jgi:hypothetical protein
MARLALLFLAAALSFAAPAAEISLSATISVLQSVFHVKETGKLSVSFTVTNAGTSDVDPDIDSSHLFVNGAVPDGWTITIANGIRSPQFKALPPGQTLYFVYQLGPPYFAKPGLYKVRWKGAHFEAPEITFRVVPD